MDEPFDANSLVNDIENYTKKSELYDSNVRFKIYIRSDHKKYNLLPLQFEEMPYAHYNPINNNIFVNKANLKKGESYHGTISTVRDLSSIIAHETIHVLVPKKYGFIKSRILICFDKNNFVKDNFGFVWKEEGYAEYISHGLDFVTQNDVEKILKCELTPYPSFLEKYIRGWIAIKFLIEKRNLSFNDIFEQSINLDEIIRCTPKNRTLALRE